MNAAFFEAFQSDPSGNDFDIFITTVTYIEALRNTKEKIHTLEGHNDAVTSLSWHPQEVGILGSGSYDRRIIFWDLAKVGEEQLPEDQEDGPPEL